MYIQDVRERSQTMPNWVMNELTCIFQTQEELNAFKMKANTEGLYNSFFPMPEILVDTQSPNIDVDKLILDYNKETNSTAMGLTEIIKANHPLLSRTAQQMLKNQQAFIATGYYDWYTWNLDNWGVKWEASDVKVKELSDFNTVIFEFNSPWGCPEHFVRELSKLYPNATFEMVSGSIENDSHYEFTCENGNYQETCSYESFKHAVVDGKWGGWSEWAELLEESEEV
jgi:hypothetical protein